MLHPLMDLCTHTLKGTDSNTTGLLVGASMKLFTVFVSVYGTPPPPLLLCFRDQTALAALVDVRAKWDWSHMPTYEEPWRVAVGQ
jgi:hypothetical protein